MPDNATVSSPPATVTGPVTQPSQVGPEGTSLWNLQTQAPEWVPLPLVKDKLSSGAYRSYAGSDVGVTPGIGGEGALPPEQAATAVAGGATVTHSEAFRDLEARKDEFARQYDNAGDKALAAVDGAVSGLSGGLMDGLPAFGKYSQLQREARGEFNGGYKTIGELAALAATLLAPESALRFTPLGLTNDLFAGTAAATDAALTTRVASKLARKGISEAVGGAIASGVLSSANAVEQSVQGKPVSGYAILDDVGLGALIGGGLGVVGEKLAGAANKAKNVKSQIEAAARFDESALPVRGSLVDVSKAWDSAHNVAGARVDALHDLVESGALDADMPGKDWLAARTEAKATADTARAKLQKLAGTDDPTAIGERLHDLAVSGKAKDAQKLYKAFDDYGTAVSRLDDAMQPTTFDQAHLHDVIGNIDETILAGEHPMQRLEQMINNGSPKEEIEKFAQELDDAYNGVKKGTPISKEVAERPTADVRAGRQIEPTPVHEINFNHEPVVEQYYDPLGYPQERKIEFPKGPKLGADINAPASEEAVKSTLLGGSRAGNEQAGFQAKKILDQVRVERATGVMSPTRPTELGSRIQSLMDKLTADTGNRLGSTEARALANKLGMNTAALNGPVSQKLADLWALHRMSESLAETLGPRASKSKLKEALSWGVVSGAGSVGFHAAGPVGAGVMRDLARQGLGAALHGAASISAAAGRFRQSAVNGLAKVFSPVGRRAMGLGAITKVVSSTYQPEQPATTNYATKAQQLRQVLQNPEPVKQHIQAMFKDLGAVDPMAYTATVDAAMTRLTNLARALPNNVSISAMVKSRGPTAAQVAEWHQYEAVTADRELVFKYLRRGMMPQGVIEAMNEQHPDFMDELRNYVLNNSDEVQSASHETQLALSKLLGVSIVPEASPAYVARMQEPYQKAKAKAAQAQQQAKGAQALHATPPTTVQIFQLPQH